jgi:hypothetical protein
MLFDKKTALSFASGLAAFPSALAGALLDVPGRPFKHDVNYVFNLINADIQPVSTFRLFTCQYSASMSSRMVTLVPLFLSMGEPFNHRVTRPGRSDLCVSHFHGPTIFATKGDHLNAYCIALCLIQVLMRF